MAYRVVIIDDEKEINSGFAQYFPWRKLGYAVTGQFSGAKEALEFVKREPVDLVVSDIVMPGMSGIDLAREMSAITLDPRPMLIIFSAHSDFRYAQQAMQYGCSDYILKTIDYEDLITVFTRLRQKLDETWGVQTPPVKDKIIDTVQRYVKGNPAGANLEDAAALVYLSASYLSRYFKQKTGASFTDYLCGQRMGLASEMLSDMQYKIYEISELLGYTNPFNFTRSFKKYYGVSPRDYRYSRLGRILPGDEET